MGVIESDKSIKNILDIIRLPVIPDVDWNFVILNGTPGIFLHF
jgi:hypothetical protein